MVNNNKFLNFSKLIGFTLAEVLIVIGVVGIIAALTIPALVKSTSEAEYKAAWKKQYSMLSQALIQYNNENGGSISNLFPAGQVDYDLCYTRELIENHMKVSKVCASMFSLTSPDTINGRTFNPADSDDIKDCWGGPSAKNWYSANTSNIKTKDGSTAINWGIYMAYALQDGTTIAVYPTDPACSSAVNDYSCATLIIDVNGPKGPNTWGKDVYAAEVRANKILAPHSDNTTYDCSKKGWGCAGDYLMGN